jgi:hypothetical protein
MLAGTDLASTSVKSASYTIPSGKYARINSMGSKLLINGTSAYPLLNFSMTATAVALGAATSDSIVFNTSDMYFESLSITQTRTSSAASSNCTLNFYDFGGEVSQYSVTKTYALNTINYVPAVSSVTAFNGVSLIPTAAMSGTAGTVTHSASMTFYLKKDVSNQWLPSGTVIEGNFYILEEYNEPA